MPINLLGRSFLSLNDFTPREIEYLLELSLNLKRKKLAGMKGNLLDRKNIVLIFEKESTRTRCAFEVAAYDEGARVTYLSGSHIGKKESIEDTAKVLGRFYDGIEFRGFDQETVEILGQTCRRACLERIDRSLPSHANSSRLFDDARTCA